MKAKREISFLVDKREFKLLNDVLLIVLDQGIEESIKKAKKEGDEYRITFSYDDLDEFIGYLSAEVNHAKSESKQNKLDNLCDKLENLLKLSELVKTRGV